MLRFHSAAAYSPVSFGDRAGKILKLPTQSTSDSATWRFTPGDGALLGIIASDLVGSTAAASIHISMVWWVLAEETSALVVSLMVLSIFIPLNLGALVSGAAVARVGARRLLLISKALSVCGAVACFTLLATESMTLVILAILATITYGAMGPSLSADIGRVPAITRLANRKLAAFHAANGIALVLGQVAGFAMASYLADQGGTDMAVGMGAIFGLGSLFVTWFSFPRDRLVRWSVEKPRPSVRSLTAGVISHLDGQKIALSMVVATALLIAVSDAVSDVVVPLMVRATGQPPAALAFALTAILIGCVIAEICAQAMHGRVSLRKALLLLCVVAAVALSIAESTNGWIELVVAATIVCGVAATAGTLTITDLQTAMPVSLQSQAVGLWQSLMLTTSAFVILLSGFAGTWAVMLLILVAAAGALAVLLLQRK